MTAYGSWTPASRPGIVPLHPLGFGTVLGRSFTALRQNPKVLLGFALGAQAIAAVVLVAALGGLGFAVFGRLDTMQPGTEDAKAVLAGSVALLAIAAFVLTLGMAVLGVLVQAVVVTDVAYAVVAERLTLREVWRKVKPVAWRLLGYTALLGAVVVALAAVGVGIVILVGMLAPVAALLVTLPMVLAAIVLSLWLSTKLALVPSAILLEHATITGAIRRSWQLTRTRFWPILGIIVVISIIFSTIAQVVSAPFSLLSTMLGSVFAPTGNVDTTGAIALVAGMVLTQLVVLLISAVGQVVQSTATAILYVDCRMRHEGLDLDLLAYVERRDSGADDEDPFTVHPGRQAPPRQPAGPPPGAVYAAPPSYAAYPPPMPGAAAWTAPGGLPDEDPPRP